MQVGWEFLNKGQKTLFLLSLKLFYMSTFFIDYLFDLKSMQTPPRGDHHDQLLCRFLLFLQALSTHGETAQ
jgi:hypothetical protein